MTSLVAPVSVVAAEECGTCDDHVVAEVAPSADLAEEVS